MRIVAIGALGIASGLPVAILSSTLTYWLFEVGLSKTHIGLFAITTTPYGLKFLWGPLVDTLRVPLLGGFLGQRRSWLLVVQVGLGISLIGIGRSHPQHDILVTACWAFLLALFSAIQDVVYEAYRTEILTDQDTIHSRKSYLGYGIGVSMSGYQCGSWIAGAGALYVAALFSWEKAYHLMSCGMFCSIVVTLLSPTPLQHKNPLSDERNPPLKTKKRTIFLDPFKMFMQKKNWALILVFIFAYKIGDMILYTMTPCFVSELGFSKIQIANVTKSFGIGVLVCGGFVGGFLLNHFSLMRLLLWSCVLKACVSALFVLQVKVGYHVGFLFLTMGTENFAFGLSQVFLIAYLTLCCQRPYTATHYALLSSVGALNRLILPPLAGWIADRFSWDVFYSLSSLLSLVGILFLKYVPAETSKRSLSKSLV